MYASKRDPAGRYSVPRYQVGSYETKVCSYALRQVTARAKKSTSIHQHRFFLDVNNILKGRRIQCIIVRECAYLTTYYSTFLVIISYHQGADHSNFSHHQMIESLAEATLHTRYVPFEFDVANNKVEKKKKSNVRHAGDFPSTVDFPETKKPTDLSRMESLKVPSCNRSSSPI